MYNISHIEFYLPKINYSNDLLIENKLSVEKIINKVGINTKFASAPNEYSTDLAIKAIKKIFKKEKSLKYKIDFLIYCTQSPDYSLPSGSSYIQNILCWCPKNAFK